MSKNIFVKWRRIESRIIIVIIGVEYIGGGGGEEAAPSGTGEEGAKPRWDFAPSDQLTTVY